MKLRLISFSIIAILLCAFVKNEHNLFEAPKQWPKPVYDFTKNPLSQPKIDLGKVLFYDPILSRNNTISCASCHSQYSGFTHIDHSLSHGIDDSIGTRNSPTLLNLAWQKVFMWDGSVNHLDVQALAPIQNKIEMDESISNVVLKLQKSKLYKTLFYRAYGDSMATGEKTLKAISQFMLMLVSNNSKYDSVMCKQSTFTTQEENGYRLFKKNCASCHQEPFFTNHSFENNGLPLNPELNDFGRYRVTKVASDSLKFKVPTLRNIEFSFPYMHDGRFKKLSQVLNHYTAGIENTKTLSKALKQPIVLSSNEKVDIIAFLLTLTDKSFLFNPRYSYPKSMIEKIEKE